VKKVRAATAEELQEVSGIGPALAATIAAELATADTAAPAVNLTTGEILDGD
jgi:excinuclease ABC subunit C